MKAKISAKARLIAGGRAPCAAPAWAAGKARRGCGTWPATADTSAFYFAIAKRGLAIGDTFTYKLHSHCMTTVCGKRDTRTP